MRILGKILLLLILGTIAVLGGRMLAQALISTPSLLVEVKPVGAAVFVDHEFRGCATPRLIVSDLAPGKHLVRVSAAGHTTVSQIVTVEAGQAEVGVDLKPHPMAALRLVSQPAGATVVVDGHVRGRAPLDLAAVPPGHHSIEITMTNYFTELRDVNLESGNTKTLEVPLRHRQVDAYRARMKRDPGDIQVYNDLGELLYVLGRYREAAEVFVEGFVAAGTYGHRDEPNKRNTTKLEREARNKHRHPDFQKALDMALLKALAAGKASPQLLKECKRIPRHLYKEERTRAMEGLVKRHPESNEYMLQLIEYYHDERDHAMFVDAVERLLKRPTISVSDFLRLWSLLRLGYLRSNGEARAKILAATRHSLEVAAPSFQTGSRVGDYLYERARVARTDGDREAYHKWLEQAVQKQRSGRQANLWRLELAREYLQGRQFDKARQHLEAILVSKDHRDPSIYKARRLLKDLEKRAPKSEPKAGKADAWRRADRLTPLLAVR